MSLKKSTVAAMAVLALAPATALAATTNGGPRDERLVGTQFNDIIDGAQGNDRIFGLAGDDLLLGHAGNDRIHGGAGNDQLAGDVNQAGDVTSFDRLWGGQGDDTLRGGDARDWMHGGQGNDTLLGQAGRDVLFGGRGDDTMDGQGGNDRIRARDGARDSVRCGEGVDIAVVDRNDIVDVSCEKVRRPN